MAEARSARAQASTWASVCDSIPAMWQLAFVATSIALGESLDDALRALDDEAISRHPFIKALRSESRETRARALAEHLAPIAADVEASELTWRA